MIMKYNNQNHSHHSRIVASLIVPIYNIDIPEARIIIYFILSGCLQSLSLISKNYNDIYIQHNHDLL